jgi:DNA-binding transcriptional MerR regulator
MDSKDAKRKDMEIEEPLPPIPVKRYFTIGEVSELCGLKPHVLRYWEQEFTQLKPVKRRGNRRYYQHHEVLLIRRIRELLYKEGFTISGARLKLAEGSLSKGAVLSVESDHIVSPAMKDMALIGNIRHQIQDLITYIRA